MEYWLSEIRKTYKRRHKIGIYPARRWVRRAVIEIRKRLMKATLERSYGTDFSFRPVPAMIAKRGVTRQQVRELLKDQ